MRQQTFEDIDEEYKVFVDKFKPRKTTDDCYTPDNIYQCVLDWAAKRYGFDKSRAVRPFWPGEDFTRFEYPDGCVVVDNPPFSILAKIQQWYLAHKIDFFLFAPGFLMSKDERVHIVSAGIGIVYQNGAVVPTAFRTNLGEAKAMSAPDLHDALDSINAENIKRRKKVLRKLDLPLELLTMGRLHYLAIHGVEFSVGSSECVFVNRLDNYDVFGGGLILSDCATKSKAAAERAAAERAAAESIDLSPREREIVKLLSQRETRNDQAGNGRDVRADAPAGNREEPEAQARQ